MRKEFKGKAKRVADQRPLADGLRRMRVNRLIRKLLYGKS